MQLFYTDRIENNLAFVSTSEAQHLSRVLRKRVGDELHLMDGKGGRYTGNIIELKRDSCVVEIQKKEIQARRAEYHLSLAVAPTKNNDRFEWFLEKATEIGIDRITPILCDRSERKRLRIDRMEKVLLAAAKQSLQAFIPQIDELTPFAEWIKSDLPQQRYIAWCDQSIPQHLQSYLIKNEPLCILIGPEGDFSPKEVALAKEHQFQEIHLGSNRLRTETAAIVAAHTVALSNILLA